jgi:glycosyltransferase involved in cell wall biosynthesis
MRPVVSLVMPVWQTPRSWLLEAVHSVLEERDVPIEVVLVDDGSPEPAERLLESVDDARLRISCVEHAGPSAARNVGIAAATGEWIRFVDSDDVVVPGSTERLYRAASGERVIAYGATLVCNENLEPQRLISSDLEGPAEVQCLLGRFEVRVVSMLFPRDVVVQAGEWDPTFRVSGDWDFVLRALELAPVKPVDVVATHYRRHAASVTRTADIAAGEHARERIVERYFERHPDRSRSRLARRARAAVWLDGAAAHAHHGAARMAFARLGRAALIRPIATTAAAGRLLPRILTMPLRRLGVGRRP